MYHTVDPENIAAFLVKDLAPFSKEKREVNITTRILGTRIKHQMGEVS
jgi:hypothetical protein